MSSKNEWMNTPLNDTDTARADTGASTPFGRRKAARPYIRKPFDIFNSSPTWNVFDDHTSMEGNYDHIVDDGE